MPIRESKQSLRAFTFCASDNAGGFCHFNLPPEFLQTYFVPLFVIVAPEFEHLVPKIPACAVFGIESKVKMKTRITVLRMVSGYSFFILSKTPRPAMSFFYLNKRDFYRVGVESEP
jgi:hypothetical protein